MDSLSQLCDVLSQNVTLADQRAPWLWRQSSRPQPSAHFPFCPAQLQGVLAIARLLAQCQDLQSRGDLVLVLLEFIRTLPSLPKEAPFPKALGLVDGASRFFMELTRHLVKIVESGRADAEHISGVMANVIQAMVSAGSDEDASSSASRAFLSALAQNCPRFHPSDVDRVSACLLEHWILPAQAGMLPSSSSETSAQGSPFVKKYLTTSLSNGAISPDEKHTDSPDRESLDYHDRLEERGGNRNFKEGISPVSTPSTTPNATPSTTPLKISDNLEERADNFEEQGVPVPMKVNGNVAGRGSLDQLTWAHRLTDNRSSNFKQQLLALQDETLESLEKQQTALRILAGILDKTETNVALKDSFLRQLRIVVTKHLKALPSFLKLRKRDWPAAGIPLKLKINVKLQVSQAAVLVHTKCFLKMEVDGKAFKSLLRETLALLLDAADACVISPWRKLNACEELFSSLLSGVAQTAAARGSHILRVLLLRLKNLILATCAQADTWGNSQGPMFDSIVEASCKIVNAGWNWDRPAVESFLLALAANICELGEQEEKEKQVASMMQLNVIHLLADVAILMNKPDVVEMILPRFIERLEEGDASVPSHLRLRLLDAVARMASLGFEKSYRETVVLLTRSYLDKLSTVGSTQSRTLAPEATTERVETLPRAFLTIATGLKQAKLRSDYRHRLLILCSDVGLAGEAKSGKSGADLLGPLLPAVAEICSDFEPCQDLEPSLFKLFRNLWFYIVLFGLAPPIQKIQTSSKSISSSTASLGSSSAMALQAVAGPYMWNIQWLTAVQRITEGTPPLVVSPVKWLEDELELNELHNPESRRGSSNEKAAIGQRAALSAALGGRVEIGSMNSISGVKATYLLAVAFLEILRLSYNGGILRSSSMEEGKKSALRCAFEYLETPNLMPAVYQCLTAVVHRAFDAALAWLEEKITAAGNEAEERESVLISHACFLITNMTHREENVRELSGSLLSQLKSKFPQILWNSSCMDSLLQLVGNYTPPSMVADLSGVASLRSFLQRQVREWVLQALLLAPCTTHGLLQEQFRKLITWPKASHTTDLLSVLSEIRLDSTRSEGWNNSQTVSVPAVLAAAAAAAGASPYMAEVGSLEVLSTGIVGANVKSNYIYVSIGGLTLGQGHLVNSGSGTFLGNMLGHGGGKLSPDRYMPAEKRSLNEMLIARFLQLLQQFVTTAERGAPIDIGAFRETCLQATALLLSDTGICRKGDLEGFSQLIRLLCWCPAYISTPEAMETGVFVWTWVVSAAPHLDSLVLAELVDAWLWTIDTGYGLFASGVTNSGPAASLRPHLTPGEPVSLPSRDPVEGITAHRLWLGFLLDRFEVVRHSNTEQLLLVGRLLEGSLRSPEHFSCHPAATGAFFTLMLLGLKFCSSQIQNASPIRSMGLHLLEDRVYRAALAWFAVDPGWYDSNMDGLSLAEAQAVAVFVQHLALERPETFGQGETHGRTHFHEGDVLQNSNVTAQLDNAHPVWGKMDNYVIGREKRKQLLLLLCQHEADRMDTWGNPLKDSTPPRLRVSSDRWIEYVRTAWSVDPRIALALVTRFPAVAMLRSEVTSMVQTHISDLYVIPEALPYFVTPKAVEENSSVLQHLPHWAPCSITRVLEFLTPSYKGHPRVMAYVLRVLESYPREKVTFFMPQLLQALRYDDGDLVQRYLMSAAQRSNLFAHILIWQLQGEEPPPSEDAVKESAKANPFHEMVLKVKQRIVDSFTPEAYDMYLREFRFFDEVTDISGVLFPLPKEQRRAAIKRELEKIKVEGDDLYLPTAPNKLVRGIQLDSGIPLQSAAKVPIMIRFNVVEKDGDPFDVKPQACMFKVGDDCRQDVLALQVIALLRDIFQAVHLNLYLFPYGVLPTGCGKGIIEIVPNTRSRNEMGETTDGGLYEIFQQEYGPVGSPRFEAARDKFIVSSAGYAVASLLLQPKDRHNGNLLFDSEGRLVHIDFGFILETSPGGNLRFESAQFKLSHEMTQLLDPSGVMKSEKWIRFVSLCVKGYLAARQHMDGIINTVLLMVDSGLPCFSRGDPIGNLRKRFHPEMSEREAANFMMKTCADAYNKWSTAGYDLIQYLQQGIEK